MAMVVERQRQGAFLCEDVYFCKDAGYLFLGYSIYLCWHRSREMLVSRFIAGRKKSNAV